MELHQPRTDYGRTSPPPHSPPRVGQVYLDTKTRQVRWLNETARQLHQEGVPVTPADLGQHPLRTPDGKPVYARDLPLLRAWQERSAQQATFLLSRPGERVEQVRWEASPLFDSEGAVAGVMGTVVVWPPEPDWQALAGLAHDLRTPLQAMQLFLSVLEHSSAPAQLQEVFGRVRSSSERAQAIARDLLEWCRSPLTGARPTEKVQFPLRPFLEALLGEHAPAAQRKSLILVSRLDDADGWEVCCDRVRLGRLLSNLLSNAVRYTPRGRVEFAAQWQDLPPTRGEEDPFGSSESARTRRPSLVLSVVDTGVGIATEEQESIFQPFERGRGAAQDPESSGTGSGIGLSVVDRLVEELGLSLEVYSIYGRGSAFDLVIPPRMLHAREDPPLKG